MKWRILQVDNDLSRAFILQFSPKWCPFWIDDATFPTKESAILAYEKTANPKLKYEVVWTSEEKKND